MVFQCEFVRLRIWLLQTHQQLVHTCNTFRTCPPPAIATAMAVSNRHEISRVSQILNQVRTLRVQQKGWLISKDIDEKVFIWILCRIIFLANLIIWIMKLYVSTFHCYFQCSYSLDIFSFKLVTHTHVLAIVKQYMHIHVYLPLQNSLLISNMVK